MEQGKVKLLSLRAEYCLGCKGCELACAEGKTRQSKKQHRTKYLCCSKPQGKTNGLLPSLSKCLLSTAMPNEGHSTGSIGYCH